MRIKTVSKSLMVLALLATQQIIAATSVDNVASLSAPVSLNIWHRNAAKVRAKADEENIPVMVYFGRISCPKCETLRKVFNTSEFRAWQAEADILFLYASFDGSQVSTDINAVWRWFSPTGTTMPSMDLPMVKVYYRKPNGSLINSNFLARAPDNTATAIINKVNGLLAGQGVLESPAIALSSYTLAGSDLKAYTSDAIAVSENQQVAITALRDGSTAEAASATVEWGSELAATLTWAEGQSVAKATITIPASDGYVLKKKLALNLKAAVGTPLKSAASSVLNFTVASRFTPLTTYAKTVTHVPFSTKSNAWIFEKNSGTDTLRTAALEAGKSAAMSATLTGVGTLSFDAVITGAGTLSANNGVGELDLSETVTIPVAAGKKTVTLTFVSKEAGSYATISNIEWRPGDALLSAGSFTGYIAKRSDIKRVAVNSNAEFGRLTATVNANRSVSGKIEFPASGTYTFKGTLGDDNTITNLNATKSKASPIEGLTLSIEVKENGTTLLSLGNASIDGKACRNLWNDKPLNAVAPAGVLNQYFTATIDGDTRENDGWDDVYGSGYITVTVSKSGVAKYSGVLADGATFSGSSPVLVDENGASFFVLYGVPKNYNGGGVLAIPAITDTTLEADLVFWKNLSTKASACSPDGTFLRLPTINGGVYNKKAALSDYYANGIEMEQFNAASRPEMSVKKVTVPADVWGASEGAINFALNAKGSAFNATNADRNDRVTLTVKKATGLFSGKMRVDYPTTSKTISYKGVMTPNLGESEVVGRGFYLHSLFADGDEIKRDSSIESGDVILLDPARRAD